MPVPFEQLVFDESEVNIAIDDLLAYARGLMDTTGQQACFANADYGWNIPEGDPTGDDVPMLRIWSDSGTRDIDNQMNLMSSGNRTLNLFFYFYAFGDTNIQAQRERFVDHFLNHLSDQATLDSLHTDEWRINFDTKAVIDHTQALKHLADYIRVEHPWYVTRIDLEIEVFIDLPPV